MTNSDRNNRQKMLWYGPYVGKLPTPKVIKPTLSLSNCTMLRLKTILGTGRLWPSLRAL